MLTFLWHTTHTPLVPQEPSTPSLEADEPLSTNLSLSSSPTSGGRTCRRLKEFTFTMLPSSTLPSNTPPKLLDLFPSTNSLCRNNDANDNKRISDSAIPLASQREPRWIRKRLTRSDVNTSCRLLLSKEEVNKYVLPWISQKRRNECHSYDGLKVKTCDVDTDSEHELVFKRWSSGSYVLTSHWRSNFVERRDLKDGDIIEVLWDFKNLRFLFRKLNVQS